MRMDSEIDPSGKMDAAAAEMKADSQDRKDGLAAKLLTVDKDVSPDFVTITYAERSSPIRLNLSLLEAPDAGAKPMILVEGDSETLLFLADLLIAQAQDSSNCGKQIAPDGPGNSFFEPRSAFGIYIHCLPCPDSNG